MRTTGRAMVLVGMLALTSVAMPALAQEWTIFAADAKSRGAWFLVDAPEVPGCIARWWGERNTANRTATLSLDCRKNRTPMTEVTARFRMFERYGLMPPWLVGRFVVTPRVGAADLVRVVRPPVAGGADPSFEVELTTRRGSRLMIAEVLLTAAAPATRPHPMPNCGPAQNAYACVADRDCASGFTCDRACGSVCLRVDRAALPDVPAAPHVIDLATVAALTRLRFETGPPYACDTRAGPRRHESESAVLSVDCVHRPWSARVRFDLFGTLNLHPAWVVDTAAITPISVGPRSSVDSVRLPTAGQRSLATSVHLRAQRGEQVSQALSIVARPVPPAQAFGEPLPYCMEASAAPSVPAVCQTDADCAPTPGPPLACRTECGRRCVFR